MTAQQIQDEIIKVNTVRGYRTTIKSKSVKEAKRLFVQLRDEQEKFDKMFKTKINNHERI